MGLACPKCGSENHGVTDSRPGDGAVRRRRACFACGARFSTMEEVVTLRALTRAELNARLRLARDRYAKTKNGDRYKSRRLARVEAAETGEPVELIYQRWGVQ